MTRDKNLLLIPVSYWVVGFIISVEQDDPGLWHSEWGTGSELEKLRTGRWVLKTLTELISVTVGQGMTGSGRAMFLKVSWISDTILTFSRDVFTCHYERGWRCDEQEQRTD